MHINDLKFADGANVIDHNNNYKHLRENVRTIKREGQRMGVNIDSSKTNIMAFGLKEFSVENPIEIDGQSIVGVENSTMWEAS